ncbi:hypothetical protein V2O64_04960 [Verrucomicrobiaceae bacterium 227]
MRLIVFTFILSTLGLSAGSPTDAALRVLKGLQKPDAAKGTPKELVISPFCGPGKLRTINDAWTRRASWLTSEKVEVSPGFEKVDGELAAVLIQARPADNPDSATMIALGLKQDKGDWRVAPIEGSFDNVGLGFGREIRKRSAVLEHWMASERGNGIAALREAELKKFNEALSRSVDPDLLKTEDPAEALQHFLNAAEEGRVNEVLVWLGLLERDEFSDRLWEKEIRVTRLGMKNQDARSAWEILTSGSVMKVIMEGDGDEEDATYMVAFLSSFEVEPDDNTRTPIRFHLIKTTKGWRIELPAFFSHADESSSGHRAAHREEFSWQDRELSKEMGRVFEETHEAVRDTDPDSLMKGIIAEINGSNLTGYLRRIFREVEDEAGDEEDAELEDLDVPDLEGLNNLPPGARFRLQRNNEVRDIDERRIGRYQEAVNWWGEAYRDEKRANVVLKKVYQKEGLALGVIMIEPAMGSWEPSFMNVWMASEETGWAVIPGLERPMENSYDPSLTEVRKALWEDMKGDLVKMEEDYLAELWKKVGTMNPAGAVVSEEDGRRLVIDWRLMLINGSMMQLLEKSAIRKIPDTPSALLRDLGFVRAGAAAATEPDRIIDSRVFGKFRGFSLMVDEGRGLEMSCPLVIVVPSEAGPRVLVDVEIFLETNKAKRMRNEEMLETIEGEMGKEDFAALKELVTWHEETSRPVWDKWNTQKSAE